MIESTNDRTYRLRGLSTDKKPILDERCNGSSFLEMDTGKQYVFDGESRAWILWKSSGGGGGGSGSYSAGKGIYITSDDEIEVDEEYVALKSDLQKVEGSSVNGNIVIDGVETEVYSLPEDYEEYLKEHAYKSPEIIELSLYDNDGAELLDEYETGDEAIIGKIRHRESNAANIDGQLSFEGQSIPASESASTASLKKAIAIGATTTLALTGTDTNGKSFSKEKTIAFADHAYSAVSSEDSAPTDGLTKESGLAEFSEGGNDFGYEAGDYLYLYVKDAGRTVETGALGQWCEVDFEELGTIGITQANGVKADYAAYRVGPFMAAGHAKYRV